VVRELLADGFTVEDLRDAVAKDRIALLPIERLLRSDSRHVPRYSVEQVAELAGVSLEHLQAANAALGLPVAAPGFPLSAKSIWRSLVNSRWRSVQVSR
jgi:hypothetical protein